MKKFLYIFILLFIVGWAQAQQRVVYTINDGWKFTKDLRLSAAGRL